MYINMVANKLLTLTHCIHIEIFLIEVGIILTRVNVTFENKVEEVQHDPKEILDELSINEDWESQNQITID